MSNRSYTAGEIIEAIAKIMCCGDKICLEPQDCAASVAYTREARAAYLVSLQLGSVPTEEQIEAGRVGTMLKFQRTAISGRIDAWAARDCWTEMNDARIREVEGLGQQTGKDET